MALPAMTPERQQQARAAKVAKRANDLALALNQDWLSEPLWMDLARAAGLRLPAPHRPPPASGMRAFLKRAGIPVATYLAWAGYPTLGTFWAWNPHWTLRAWAGMVLEHRDQIGRGA